MASAAARQIKDSPMEWHRGSEPFNPRRGTRSIVM